MTTVVVTGKFHFLITLGSLSLAASYGLVIIGDPLGRSGEVRWCQLNCYVLVFAIGKK